VVVLSSNDGCIIARSQEIKDSGIPMGVPYFQVKDKLRNLKAAVFSSNFTLYRDLSARVARLVRENFTEVEQYSIDELFFVLDDPNDAGDLLRLKEQINREVGLPVSIGVGFSKTQAKYANQVAKKTTGYHALSSKADEGLSNLPLTEVWGVGSGLGRQLRGRGLVRVADLVRVSEQQLQSWFGVVVARLQAELSGEICYPVTVAVVPQKSYVSSRSLPQATTNESVLRAALAFHTEQVAKDLWQGKQKAGEIRVLLYPDRYGDYVLRNCSLTATLVVPAREISELQNLTANLFAEGFDPTVPYKKVGVAVSRLQGDSYAKASLFGDSAVEEAGVSDLVLEINQRLGAVLHVGAVPKQQAVFRARQEHISPAYTTRWSDVCVVKATS